ncbi:MAG TPA: patatin-like phospholipase family protein [Actinomycetota bacterium]|nr:patatin-like phospholipase family protein [Actinomycetota bacterium]
MTELDGSANRVTAFVLGGGGHLGANEVGMLQALLERDITPDLIVGTSVGALNGVAIAAEPSLETVGKLREAWLALGKERVFASPLGGAANLARKGTHLHSNQNLKTLIERLLPVERFEELKVPFQCVAASIERAAEHWFTEGPIAPAILASAAVPGLLPPVEIGGEHFLDGGLVNSIPVERAIQLGATELYILHVGRIEQPLKPPRNLIQVAMVAFEIGRRHRFARDMASLPEGVIGHVLPTGEETSLTGMSQLKYRDFTHVAQRMEASHRASAAYLEGLAAGGRLES